MSCFHIGYYLKIAANDRLHATATCHRVFLGSPAFKVRAQFEEYGGSEKGPMVNGPVW